MRIWNHPLPAQISGGWGWSSDLAVDRFHVIAVRIEHEGGVVARWITLRSVPKTGRSVVDPTCLESRRVEGADLSSALGSEGCMLLYAGGVEAVDPETG